MAIAKVGSSGLASIGTNGSLTGVYGQSPTAGNLLIAAVVFNVSGSSLTMPTPPTGWTVATSATPSNTTSQAGTWLLYKVAAGGDAAPVFTVTASTTPFSSFAVIEEWSGLAASSPLDLVATPATSTSAGTTVSHSLTSTVSGLMFSVLGLRATGTTATGTWGGGSSADTAMQHQTTGTSSCIETGSQSGPAGAQTPSNTYSCGAVTRPIAILLTAAFKEAVVPTTGTATSTLAALTQTAAGTTTAPGVTTGTAASTLAALTQAATGTVAAPPTTGTTSSTLAALTQAAAGTVTAAAATTGTAASVLPSFTQAAYGPGGTPDTPTSIPDGFTAWEYERDGVTLVGQLVNARGLKWRDANSQPGVKSFEVPLADAGTLAERSIVKFGWEGEIRDACVVNMEGCTLAVDGTVWLKFENQPGLLAMWADAGADPEWGLARNGGTERHFGFMSQIGVWKVDADWDTPTGFTYTAGLTVPQRGSTPSAFAASNPYWISAAGPDVNVPEEAINYFRYRFFTGGRKALEIECSGDNFLTLYLDGEELKTPDPADPHAWYSADSIRVSIPEGDHILAASVANSYFNGGLESEDHRNNPIALILTAWELNAKGERGDVFFKTNLADWIVNDGDPEPGWHRAQVIRKLYEEAVARSVEAETVLGAPPNGVRLLPINFGWITDSDGNAFSDRGQYTVDVASVPLSDITTQMCEADIDVWVDPVAMRVNTYKRRGSDLSGSVELKVGADGGNLLDYTTTKTRARQTSITMRLAGDTWYRVPDEDAIAESGLIETGLDVGSTSSRLTAAQIGQAALDQSAVPTIEVTAKTSLNAAPRPYLEFGIGDTITMPGHRGVGTMKARCLAITVDASSDTPEVVAEFVEDRAA